MKKIIQSIIIIGLCLLPIKHLLAIDLSVRQGKVAAKPIAIVPFANDLGDKVGFIIASDLKQSGVFTPISPASYRDRPTDNEQINYATFQALGATYVIIGKIIGTQNIKFVITDVFQKKIIGSYNVLISPKSLRQSAHEVSDIILEKLTGARGAFATKLIYIHELRQSPSRRYQIILSDSDGADPIILLSSSSPIMSPRFSPNGNQLAYVTFEGQQAQIVTHDINTGRRELVSKEKGINSAPAWSPDGNKIAMVLSRDGNPEIYFKDLSSGQLVRVTNNPGIDTEPVWSANGQSLYFTSDRTGSPQIYRINLSNGYVSRVTITGRYSAGADISDNGKKIALTRSNNGHFIIGIIDILSGQFNAVSKGFVDETPRFSPNSQMLIFTSVKNNREVLKIVNIDGSGSNTLSTSGNIRDPDWSGYIR